MKDRDHSSRDESLADALEAVRRDDAETSVPPHVEAAVMRAWDAHTVQRVRDMRLTTWGRSPVAVLAACAVLAMAIWIGRDRDMRTTNDEPINIPPASQVGDAPSYSFVEALASPDLLLDEDPTTLQVVRMSVEPSVLIASGFPAVDPADDGPVAIEVLIGLDGVPRAIRRAGTVQE